MFSVNVYAHSYAMTFIVRVEVRVSFSSGRSGLCIVGYFNLVILCYLGNIELTGYLADTTALIPEPLVGL